MAKTTSKTKTKVKAKAPKAAAIETIKPAELLRKGALAYIGLYGAAYEQAKLRIEKVRGTADELFGTYVEKGTDIEAQAGVLAKNAQIKALETFAATSDRVRGVLPKASNDRVQELEDEIAKLNKKITALSKKKKTARKPRVKTEKTTPAALAKAAEPKAA